MWQLYQGGNVSYSSKQVVAEFLFCLSNSMKQKVLLKMKSPTISTYESTDMSVSRVW